MSEEVTPTDHNVITLSSPEEEGTTIVETEGARGRGEEVYITVEMVDDQEANPAGQLSPA